MIRLILVAIFLVLYFILSIIPYFVLWVVGKFNPDAKGAISRQVVKAAFHCIIFICGIKLKVVGKENLLKDQAVLYVGNHRSFFDIVTVYPQFPEQTGFIAKKELNKVPFLRVWMRYIHCLFIDRSNIREGMKTILAGIEQLKSGVSVFICPEGTRSKDGTVLEFKEGGLKMASKAKVPIIPVAFTGTSAIFEDHFPWIKKGNVTIQFGEPIYIDQLEKEEQKHLGAYTREKVVEMLAREDA